MSQLLLKGVYYDDESGALWFLNNSGSYEEISVGGTTIYTGDGSLEGDRVLNLNGHELQFLDSQGRIFGYWSEDEVVSYTQASDGIGTTFLAAYADSVGTAVKFWLSSAGGGTNVSIIGDSVSGQISHSATINDFVGLVQANGGLTLSINGYADNAAALSGGVPSGGVYYTDVSGERILKQAHD